MGKKSPTNSIIELLNRTSGNEGKNQCKEHIEKFEGSWARFVGIDLYSNCRRDVTSVWKKTLVKSKQLMRVIHMSWSL